MPIPMTPLLHKLRLEKEKKSTAIAIPDVFKAR